MTGNNSWSYLSIKLVSDLVVRKKLPLTVKEVIVSEDIDIMKVGFFK
jgi:hypothetical protein